MLNCHTISLTGAKRVSHNCRAPSHAAPSTHPRAVELLLQHTHGHTVALLACEPRQSYAWGLIHPQRMPLHMEARSWNRGADRGQPYSRAQLLRAQRGKMGLGVSASGVCFRACG
eukprot:366468-Chlamydomonas_euryale.AAC.10